MAKGSVSRRVFLGSTAAGAAGLAVAASPVSNRVLGANERLAIGILGPGGRGNGLMNEFFNFGKELNVELTAVCDTWNRNRERAAGRTKDVYGREPQKFRRLEEMVEKAKLDAVIIATPDHQHGGQLAACVKAGLDVYCEKPMGNDLEQANHALRTVRASNRVVQIGTQRRSDGHWVAAAELVRTGVLGTLTKVDVIWNAYSAYRWRRDADVQTLKESDVDWKAFLAGKPFRPFDPRQYLEFRLFRDFSSGIIDQWMSHGIDAVHMVTGAQYPRSVVASGGTYAWKDHRENPDTLSVALEYPEGFQCIYATTLTNRAGRGTRVVGTRGTLEVDEPWQLSGAGSEAKDRIEQARPIQPKSGVPHHMKAWLLAIRERYQPNCPVEAGHSHSVACIMATRALWSGRRQLYDPETMRIREA